MIVQIYVGKIAKELFFPDNVMDGRHTLQLYTYETGLSEDIEFYIDINNGVKRITGKSVTVVENTASGGEDNLIEYDHKVILSESLMKLKIALLAFKSENDTVVFRKYITNSNVEVGVNGSISYKTEKNVPRLFDISYEGGKSYVIPHINRIYLKGHVIEEKTRIRFGETISYNKFKLIYFGNLVAVNNPNGMVTCSLEEFDYDEFLYEDYQGAEITQKEYFTRSPRITHRLITEEIEIDPPPAKISNKEKPLIYTIGPSLTMSMGMILSIVFMARANASGRSMIPSAIMAGTMLTGAVLWPILSRRYNKKHAIEEEQLRQDKYKQYIDSLGKELEEKSEYNREVYTELYPSLESLMQGVLKRSNRLWNHTPFEAGFLDVRIGKGTRESTIKVNVQKERFTMEDDPLRKYASSVQKKYKYLSNVPISIGLDNVDTLGVVGNREMQLDMLKLMIIRLAITHSYDELKIAVLYKEKDEDVFSFAKWLPHCFGLGKKERYISNDKNGANIVLGKIRDISNERLETKNDSRKTNAQIPRYVVFITDYELVMGNSYVLNFIENMKEQGITFVLGYDSIGRLPSTCTNIIQLSHKKCTIYDKLDETGQMLSFVPDISEGTDTRKIAEILSDIKISEAAEEASVPERLTFLEMYKARNLDDLVIEKRWQEAQPHKSLEAPLGIGANNEIFSLDIRAHGPHGLIAGTTGSGKSETIQSYILAMAINFHPYDVGFVLIDYKGGGMANAFADLPHVMATITNLDGAQINRSLISLESEIKRRQELFAEAGVNKISAYQMKYKQGLVSEPLPRLILISDEFAELKSQEPEFMAKLIQIAHIGRSLGVNLILATQKPGGVVNEQIWANSNFRICLKVADRSDSREMIKRDEAAYITNPGRCYIQVGNNEIFKLLQSGYSGAPYIENSSNEDDIDKEIVCINLQGNELYRYSYTEVMNTENLGETEQETQLSAIVNRIKEITDRQGFERIKLWIDPLPDVIPLSPLDTRLGGFNGERWEPCMEWLEPYVGMYDEPEKQSQGVVSVKLGKYGHFILYGAPGTGKTTFLQTLIYSMAKRYSPDYFHMYILDFSSRSFGYFKTLPHVSDVLMSSDDEKIKLLFRMVQNELNKRSEQFSQLGVGNMSAYMQAVNKVIPAFIVVIDGYAAFKENYEGYEQIIETVSRDGANYGVWFVITATAQRDVKSRIADNITNRFTLQLGEKFDYVSILHKDKNKDVVIPESIPGRGVFKKEVMLEYQTALAADEPNDAKRAAKLKEEFALMAECWKGEVPDPIPVIPKDMSLASVSKRHEYERVLKAGRIPIGYNTESINVEYIDFEEMPVVRIMGNSGTGKRNIMAAIAELSKDYEIWLIDDEYGSVKRRLSVEPAKYETMSGAETLATAFKDEIVKRNRAYVEYKQKGGTVDERTFAFENYPKILFMIADFDAYFQAIENQTAVYMSEMYGAAAERNGYIVVVCDTMSYIKFKTQRYAKNIFDRPEGIYMGKVDSMSSVFPSVNITSEDRRKDVFAQGGGFKVSGSVFCKILTPLVK